MNTIPVAMVMDIIAAVPLIMEDTMDITILALLHLMEEAAMDTVTPRIVRHHLTIIMDLDTLLILRLTHIRPLLTVTAARAQAAIIMEDTMDIMDTTAAAQATEAAAMDTATLRIVRHHLTITTDLDTLPILRLTRIRPLLILTAVLPLHPIIMDTMDTTIQVQVRATMDTTEDITDTTEDITDITDIIALLLHPTMVPHLMDTAIHRIVRHHLITTMDLDTAPILHLTLILPLLIRIRAQALQAAIMDITTDIIVLLLPLITDTTEDTMDTTEDTTEDIMDTMDTMDIMDITAAVAATMEVHPLTDIHTPLIVRHHLTIITDLDTHPILRLTRIRPLLTVTAVRAQAAIMYTMEDIMEDIMDIILALRIMEDIIVQHLTDMDTHTIVLLPLTIIMVMATILILLRTHILLPRIITLLHRTMEDIIVLIIVRTEQDMLHLIKFRLIVYNYLYLFIPYSF
jgi:hypothetical protein